MNLTLASHQIQMVDYNEIQGITILSFNHVKMVLMLLYLALIFYEIDIYIYSTSLIHDHTFSIFAAKLYASYEFAI